MTEETSSDPDTKTPGDGGGGAVIQPAKSGEGGDGVGISGEGGEEKWKRERWTRTESMALVTAMKQLEEDAGTASSGGDAKWKSISQICSTYGVQRTSVQCRKRWNTLLAAYRKIEDWERRNGMESYWAMGGLEFKAKKLPAGFDKEIYTVMNSFLAGRSGTSPRLFSYKPEDTPGEAVPAGSAPTGQLPPQSSPLALPQPLPTPQEALSLPLPQLSQQPVPQSAQLPFSSSGAQSSAQALPQVLPQGLQQSTSQAVPQASLQPDPQASAQAAAQAVPQASPQVLLQPQGSGQGLPQGGPQQPVGQRGGREKEGGPSRKRKRPGRQEAPSVLAQEIPKPSKLDEPGTGAPRCAFESIDPLSQFLSTFLDKSLESYERNSELNRTLRREQGDKLVDVLGSLSSAVRDLVHSSLLQK